MLSPGDRFDRYLIEELLGEGGMGRVLAAYDTRLERRVALKVLKTGADPTAAARMLAEAKAAAALDHPNAVHVHDVGEVDGVPYLAMELVTGRTLRAMLGEEIPWTTRLRWLLDAARALAAAHDIGLVHRDVKPDNVMIRPDGRATVLDFGVAHRGDGTPVGTAGTPIYMAPEQLRGHAVGGASDQFSWGVMAYEVLGGALPWGDVRSAPELVTTVLHIDPRPLRDVAPDLPPDVVRVVERALAKKSDDRWPSMHAVVEVLAPIVGAEAKVALATGEEPERKASKSKSSGRSFATAATVMAPSMPPPAKTRNVALGLGAIVLIAGVAIGIVLRRPASHAPAAIPPAPTSLVWTERSLGEIAPDVTSSLRIAVSPDGKTLAIADGKTLRVRPIDGGEPRLLPIPEGVHPSSPSFTPDGAAIIVGTREPPGAPLTEVFLDGSPPRALPGGDRGLLSPDGRHIAVASRGSLRVLRLDGSDERFLGVRDRAVRNLAWSPKGDELAVLSEMMPTAKGRAASVEIFSLDGHSVRGIAEGIPVSPDLFQGIAWPSEGHVYVLAYTSSPDPRRTTLLEVAATGPQSSRIVHEWPGGSGLDLAAGGGKLFVATTRSESGIALGALVSNKAAFDPTVPIAWASEHALPASLTVPDRIVLAVPTNAGDDILEGRPGDAAPQVLARGVFHGYLRRVDGGALLAWRDADADGPCRLVRLHDGTEEVVLRARAASEGPDLVACRAIVDCAVAAPKRCVAVVRALEEWSVRTLDPRTGTMGATIARAHRLGAHISPDGKTLAVDDDEGRLVFVTIATGIARQLALDTPVWINEQTFLPDGKRLLFVGADRRTWAPRLGVIDSRGHVELAFAEDDRVIDGVAIADDGKTLAAAIRRTSAPALSVLEAK